MVFEGLLQYQDIGLFILRLAIGVIFIYHSIPKLKDSKGMAKMIGMPSFAPFVLGLMELLSALGVIFGILIQIAAIILSVVMIGAIFFKIVKWKIPFAAMDKTGWEFDLILLAGNIAILFTGGGNILKLF